MLYYKTGLFRRVRIHPQYSGGKHDPLQVVRKKLKQDIREDFFNSEYGYIVDRIAVEKIKDGFCLPLVGFIEYLVTFEAVLLYPIVGEVVDAVVEVVTDTCIIFRHICIYGVVRSYCLNDQDYFKYEERDAVPEDKKDQSGTYKEGIFRSQTDSAKVIEKGTVIRIRITQRTLGGNGFFLIGSMSSEYLGPLKNPPPLLQAVTSGREDNSLPNIPDGIVPHDEMFKMVSQQLALMRKSNKSQEGDSDEDDNVSVVSIESLQPDP